MAIQVDNLHVQKTQRSVCEVLDWDSRFFDRKIGRVIGDTLREDTVAGINAWALQESIDCLYFLASDRDERTRVLAEETGFALVDTRVKLEHLSNTRLPVPKDNGVVIRTFAGADLAQLVAIARTSHQDSRFYYDKNFPRELCAALYETWIRKSCDGWADVVWVAEFQQRPVGYLTCHLEGNGKGRIGLVAVDSQFYRLGIGRGLENAAINWFSDKHVSDVFVVTQGRNLEAIKFYEKCGFRIQSTARWFHKWFRDQNTSR